MPKSLAGSNKIYVAMQMKSIAGPLSNNKQWNLQGKGKKVNRDYGVAHLLEWRQNLSVPLKQYLHNMPTYYRSLAPNSGERYFMVYCRIDYERSVLLIQIPENKSYNRDYGAQFEIPLTDVSGKLIRFITQNQETTAVEEYKLDIASGKWHSKWI